MNPATFTLTIAATILLALTASPAVDGSSNNLLTNIQILARLCFGQINETTLAELGACYNDSGANDIFVTCEMEAFGFSIDSGESIAKFCKSFFKWPKYSGCLIREFMAANYTMVEMGQVFQDIMVCEAEAFGIQVQSNGSASNSTNESGNETYSTLTDY